MTKDRMTVAREALEEAAKTFREYATHHIAKTADGRLSAADTAATMAKAQRNTEMAVKCEMAANLLTAQ